MNITIFFKEMMVLALNLRLGIILPVLLIQSMSKRYFQKAQRSKMDLYNVVIDYYTSILSMLHKCHCKKQLAYCVRHVSVIQSNFVYQDNAMAQEQRIPYVD